MANQASPDPGTGADGSSARPAGAPGTEATPVEALAAVPDPDEDDLDDLDDMLDEFSAVKVHPAVQEEPNAPDRSVRVEEAPAEATLSDDDFAKQLQAGMAELLGELDNSVRHRLCDLVHS
jgi:peroxin-19